MLMPTPRKQEEVDDLGQKVYEEAVLELNIKLFLTFPTRGALLMPSATKSFDLHFASSETPFCQLNW